MADNGARIRSSTDDCPGGLLLLVREKYFTRAADGTNTIGVGIIELERTKIDKSDETVTLFGIILRRSSKRSPTDNIISLLEAGPLLPLRY